MNNKRRSILWACLAILCLANSFLVRALSSGTNFYMVWIAISIMLFILAVMAHKNVWAKFSTKLKGIIIATVSLCLIIFISIEGCIVSHFNDSGKANLDYIIVLGAQVYENGPSPVLKFRLDTAIEYLEANPTTICIVSGAQGINEPFTEAEGMSAYLLENGISSDRILLEPEANNTLENITCSIKLIDNPEASVGVVTNNFHVFRALHIAKKQGIADVCSISSPSTPMYLPNNMLREFLGILKDFVKRNL